MLKIHFSVKPWLMLFLLSALLVVSGCAKDKSKSGPKVDEKAIVAALLKQNNAEIERRKAAIKKRLEDRLPEAANNGGLWILVDTEKQVLEVKRGTETVATFENIAIGRNGAGFKNRRGDNITPLGIYRIGWINDKSIYRTFYGFTYPSAENAQVALRKGLISKNVYNSIVAAHENGIIPPQHTPLGGRIGLHGLGKADEKIHRAMNWTQGCVAVTNEQIDELSQWLEEGIEVKVK